MGDNRYHAGLDNRPGSTLDGLDDGGLDFLQLGLLHHIDDRGVDGVFVKGVVVGPECVDLPVSLDAFQVHLVSCGFQVPFEVFGDLCRRVEFFRVYVHGFGF